MAASSAERSSFPEETQDTESRSVAPDWHSPDGMPPAAPGHPGDVLAAGADLGRERSASGTIASVLPSGAYHGMLVATILSGIMLGLVFLDISAILPFERAIYQVSATSAGWAVSTTIICHTLMIAAMPRWIRWTGPRGGILWGMAIMAISCVARALAPTFALLLISRGMTGIGTGLVGAASVQVIARYSPAAVKVRDQGLIGAGQQFGIVLTALLAPLGTSAWGLAPFWLGYALIMLIGFVVIMWLFPPLARSQSVSAPQRDSSPGGPVSVPVRVPTRTPFTLAVFTERFTWLLTGANVIGYAIFVGITAWIASFFADRFGVTARETAFLAAGATGMAVVGRLISGRATTWLGMRRLVIFAGLGGGVALLATPVAPNLALAVGALLVFTFCVNVSYGTVFGSVATRPAPGGLDWRITLVIVASNGVALTLPPLIGALVHLTGTYVAGFWTTSVVMFAIVLMISRSTLWPESATEPSDRTRNQEVEYGRVSGIAR